MRATRRARRGARHPAHHFRIAAGSAGEVAAVLDLVALPGGPDRQVELRRVSAMLASLVRR